MSFRRNMSPQQMFLDLVRKHTPRYRFTGQAFGDWKSAALPAVLATLGDLPCRVELNPELIVEWEHDGLRKQKWSIDVSDCISAVFQINFPPGAVSGRKHPALLCCHGHGEFGKTAIMGDDSTSVLKGMMDQAYGHHMAKQGYVTFAIDWIGFGERNDNQKPNHKQPAGGRDWCNLYYLHATMLGMTSLGINITHGRAALDFAATFGEVDMSRLGVMGLSGGGTMSLWMSLADDRIKATEVICYSDLWECFGIRDLNYCGMQVAPGLYKLVDLPELQGLLAPRPLLVDIGAADTCFRIDSAMPCFRQVERIYQAAGARDKLFLDLHSGGHAWGRRHSGDFFKQFLG